MRNIQKVIALVVLLACCAFAQQTLAVIQQQGIGAPQAGTCAYPAQVGNFWNSIGGSTNAAYLCQQNGNGTLPTFGWTPISLSSGTNTGNVVVAAGKTFTVSNTLTLAGTDSTTMTFPATSATVARSDAANTFTGVQTFSSAPVLSTGTLTSVAATMTFPATTATLARTDAAQTFTGVQTFSSAPVLSTSTLTAGSSLITFPAAAITVPGTVSQDCGTTTTCAHTATSTTLKVVTGSTALVSGSPSTAAVTGLSPAFTSSSTYHCEISNATTVANTASVLAAGYVSGSAFTITGPDTVTDVVHFVCIGT